ncbi:MAG: YfcE family phosphodiesterase [Symbiobacteriaceae bacterium]|jgi:putative phosphoesterase|nr:YfcE family phosphodiesterase [Symbiobacteriaceae bacterium]
MRIALFSDIHSNYHALEAVLSDIALRGVDRIICLGDITLKGPLPKECVDRVRDLGCPVVLGNADGCYHPDFHPDRFPPQNASQVAARADFHRHLAALTRADQDWLQNFPVHLAESWEGTSVELFHATPGDNYVLTMPWASNEQMVALRSSESTQMAAFGHCHRAFVRVVHGFTVMNTGSVGLPFDGDPRPSYALVEAERGRLTMCTIIRVEYDAEAAIKAARTVGMIGWELFAHTARTGQFPG